jgi:hypothetical protein
LIQLVNKAVCILFVLIGLVPSVRAVTYEGPNSTQRVVQKNTREKYVKLQKKEHKKMQRSQNKAMKSLRKYHKNG